VTGKPVVPREQANRDVDAGIAFYLNDGARSAALDFIDAVEAAYARISRNPAIGSPSYTHELNLPGLCVSRLSRYHFLVFYIEQPDHIDVWRVLHAQRDIPVWLQQSDHPL
jgi:toxin ParE1/3/4